MILFDGWMDHGQEMDGTWHEEHLDRELERWKIYIHSNLFSAAGCQIFAYTFLSAPSMDEQDPFTADSFSTVLLEINIVPSSR